jgi:hypothetical protein
MENVLKFLADLLTDQLDGVSLKTKALELYVELRMPKENTEHNLVFGIPNNDKGYSIHISPANYEQARIYMKAGQKISAIKHIRQTSLINGNKEFGGPGLKEAKDFVEANDWGFSTVN